MLRGVALNDVLAELKLVVSQSLDVLYRFSL